MVEKGTYEENKHLWDRFVRLGDMIGEGLHHDDKSITKEYRELMMILCPPSPEAQAFAKELRQKINSTIDEQMAALLASKKCECGGVIKQSRSGSKVAYCESCKQRFKAKSK